MNCNWSDFLPLRRHTRALADRSLPYRFPSSAAVHLDFPARGTHTVLLFLEMDSIEPIFPARSFGELQC